MSDILHKLGVFFSVLALLQWPYGPSGVERTKIKIVLLLRNPYPNPSSHLTRKIMKIQFLQFAEVELSKHRTCRISDC